MEHSELVREMRFLENLTAQERLTRAQRQRQEQIRNYVYHENNLHRSPIRKRNKKNKFNSNVRVQFPSNIILLDGKYRFISFSLVVFKSDKNVDDECIFSFDF